MVRVAIVEDDNSFAVELERYLRRYEKERGRTLHITTFSDGDEIVESGAPYDIIFMDVQMKFLDGMTAAKLIRQRDSEVIIIFLTNMPQYAIKGYEVGAMDYILKPISYLSLAQRMDRAIELFSRRTKQYILIGGAGEYRKVEVSKICYIESQNHRVMLRTTQGELISSGTLQQMEKKLGDAPFFRCNKGCLVNLEHVEAIRDNCVVIVGVALPISRGKKAALLTALTDYMNGGL